MRSWYGVSGAGTNLKVGEPVRRESGGTDPARSAGTTFLHFFGSKSTIEGLRAKTAYLRFYKF